MMARKPYHPKANAPFGMTIFAGDSNGNAFVLQGVPSASGCWDASVADRIQVARHYAERNA